MECKRADVGEQKIMKKSQSMEIWKNNVNSTSLIDERWRRKCCGKAMTKNQNK